jgi:hypothetical protein
VNDGAGSHHCECFEGYTLNADKKTCSGNVHSANPFLPDSFHGGEVNCNSPGKRLLGWGLKDSDSGIGPA